MTYENWLITTQNHITTLTLNRPQAMNALTPSALHELREIAKQLKHDRNTWVIILQSSGQHFSVGVDVSVIGQMRDQKPDEYVANLRDLQDCLDVFESLPQPIIAKIKGHCIGGALVMACCCDFRIADESARFAVPEVKLGIAVIMGTQRITRLAGIPATKEMILLGERFSPQQAQKWGLLHRLVAPDELDATVETFAEKFLLLPPRTIEIAKHIIDMGVNQSLADSQARESHLHQDLLQHPDFAEGIQAFFEKRPPNFIG
jgi:enoyl-CoA hydratase/carnithine racemase